MAYILPIHKASGVRDATAVNFFDKDITVLAAVKSQCLEIYQLTEGELTLAHQHHLYGQITTIQRVRDDPVEAEKLLVTTDRRRCLLLRWDESQRRIIEDIAHNAIDPSTRPMPYAEHVHMAPSGNFALLELSPGMLTVIPFEVPILEKRRKGSKAKKTMREASLLRIEQFSVRSATFIDRVREDDETFVILWEDGLERVHLTSYELEKKPTSDGLAVERKKGGITRQNVQKDAQMLIKVPNTDGLLMVAETSITFIDLLEDVVYYELPSPTVWLHWTAIDQSHYILADDFNRIWILTLTFTRRRPSAMEIRVIGQTAKATRLVNLGGGRIFVASHQGDSQLLQLRADYMGFEILQAIENIAPIIDFTIMDLGRGGAGEAMNEYSSGQARIVAGCGAFKTGGLRTIRSGVALEDVVKLGDIDGIDDVFSLCIQEEMAVDCLAVSLLNETRIFAATSEGIIEELDRFHNFQLDQSSILAMNAPVAGVMSLLQITASAVSLVNPTTGSWQWRPEGQGSSITLAAANEEVILVCVDGNSLLSFDWTGDSTPQRRRKLEREVSCLAVPGDDIGIEPGIAIVGYFDRPVLEVLDATLGLVRTLPLRPKSEQLELGPPSIPQSLLSTQILHLEKPTLLVGMSDGTILTSQLEKTAHFTSVQKEIVLGSQYPRFKVIPRKDGLNSVFVNCTHSTLIYGQDGRLIFSAITGEDDPTCMSSFVSSDETEDFMAVATMRELKISHVQPQRNTQIRTLPLGRTVRRIAHSAQNRAFFLGTVKQELVGNEERLDSSLTMVDEIAFEELHSLDLGDNELVEAVIVTKLPHLQNEEDPTIPAKELIIVGTSLIYEDQEPTTIKGGNDSTNYRGRLLIFQVNPQTRKMDQLCAQFLKGECRCLATAGPRIVAGLSKTTLLFNVARTPEGELVLSRTASCRLSTAPISLVVQEGTRIAVADLMKSAAILEIRTDPATGAVELVEVARHYQSVWTTAIQSVDRDTYLQSDSESNLLLLKENRSQEELAPHERRQLEVLSEFHLSEMVNQIRALDVPRPPSHSHSPASNSSSHSTTDSAVWPRALLATVEGSIYLYGLLSPSWTAPLIELQRVMGDDDRFGQNGWVEFGEFRAFTSSARTAAEPFRCVDGEFLAQFLDVDEAVQEEVAKTVGERLMAGEREVSGRGFRDLLGQLRRLQ